MAQSFRPLNVKVVFIGESTVGKTSIIEIVGTGAFDGKTVPTVAGTYVAVTYSFNDSVVRLAVWDTAGQERYKSIAPLYYRDADICCIVYAIDNRPSFDAVDSWHVSVMRELNTPPKLYLLANKLDLADGREVATQQGIAKAEAIHATFYEISAKRDAGTITQLFEQMAKEAAESGQGVTTCRSALQLAVPEESCC
jgi:small GTP-binding protein